MTDAPGELTDALSMQDNIFKRVYILHLTPSPAVSRLKGRQATNAKARNHLDIAGFIIGRKNVLT